MRFLFTQQVIANIRKEAEKVKGGEDRIEEIIAAKMRDLGLNDSTGVLKIPEHCGTSLVLRPRPLLHYFKHTLCTEVIGLTLNHCGLGSRPGTERFHRSPQDPRALRYVLSLHLSVRCFKGALCA